MIWPIDLFDVAKKNKLLEQLLETSIYKRKKNALEHNLQKKKRIESESRNSILGIGHSTRYSWKDNR